jgi:hypothetical protein
MRRPSAGSCAFDRSAPPPESCRRDEILPKGRAGFARCYRFAKRESFARCYRFAKLESFANMSSNMSRVSSRVYTRIGRPSGRLSYQPSSVNRGVGTTT